MFRNSSVLEPGAVSQMIRYLCAFQVYPHFMAVVGLPDLLSDITERNAVVMAVCLFLERLTKMFVRTKKLFKIS